MSARFARGHGRLAICLAGVTGLTLAVAGAGTGAAQARVPSPRTVSTGTLFGYVWADQPTASSYTPDTDYQANSSGATNTIARSSTGVYTVRFPNLGVGVAHGTVNVTGYGGDDAFCKVDGWFPTGSRMNVEVFCFDDLGHPADKLFDVTFVRAVGNRTAPAKLGYVWANQAATVHYTPDLTFQYNSTGATNTIQRTSMGHYTVSLPGLESTGGTVKVTPYGGNTKRCKAVSWGPNPAHTAELVKVFCFELGGLASNSLFTMTFADHESILGVNRPTGYVRADNPTASSYTPTPRFAFDSAGGTITITKTGAGQYEVRMPNLGQNHGDVQVTAYGTSNTLCQTSGWGGSSGSALGVGVLCFHAVAAWAPANSRFTVQFVR